MREEIADKARKESLRLARRMGVWIRCRHFSFIFDGTRIVSTGTNSRKTHPANLDFGYVSRKRKKISEVVGTHSELKAALRAGMEKCRGLTLVNTRVNRNGRLDNSRPCRGCADLIEKLGFLEVYYTDRKGEFRRLET